MVNIFSILPLCLDDVAFKSVFSVLFMLTWNQ